MGFSPNSGAEPDNITLNTNINGKLQIKESGVDTLQLADGAVTAPKIAPGAVPSDWEKIASVTGSTLDLSSLDTSAYKFLKIVAGGGGITSSTLQLRFNGDSGNSSYSYQRLQVSGTSVSAGQDTLNNSILCISGVATSSNAWAMECVVSNTQTARKGVTGNHGRYNSLSQFSGQWLNTSSLINRIQLIGTFSSDSTIVVYGVKA